MVSASAATPIDTPEVPITIRLPAPMPPILFAWITVTAPPITMLAKIAQDR